MTKISPKHYLDNILKTQDNCPENPSIWIDKLLSEDGAATDPITQIIYNAVNKSESRGEIIDSLQYAIDQLRRALKAESLRETY